MQRRTLAAVTALLTLLTLAPLPAHALNGDCCYLAVGIIGAIGGLTGATAEYVDVNSIPAARGASLLKSLAKAGEFMSTGIYEGEPGCDTTKARQKFQYARGWMVNYLETLDLTSGNGKEYLQAYASSIIAMIDGLIVGVCQAG